MRIVTAREFLRQQRDRSTLSRRSDVEETVRRIVASVRERGDAALREWTQTLDRVSLKTPVVNVAEFERAWKRLPRELQKALQLSAANVQRYQRALKPRTVRVSPSPGVRLMTEWIPLQRVGAYAPGGRAAYPSTVLMTCLPARVAGVREVYVASPPTPDGRPSPLVLAAAHLAHVDRVFAMGGAQALAAFAHGTESIPRVDKIVGPGNAYVAEAKRQLQGVVGTDAIAGPSELAVYATTQTDPQLVILDLLAQAEHDPEARALVVTSDVAYARRLETLVREWLPKVPRREILQTSVWNEGVIVVAESTQQVPQLLDAAAPEHVELLIRKPDRIASQLQAAGTIFEGSVSNASLGDYVTGANHVLPTGGAARWSNPLSVYDFLRQRVCQRVDPRGLKRIGRAAMTIAEAEGLPNHAAAVRGRLES